MTLTDTRKALQDILEEATATDCAVCYVLMLMRKHCVVRFKQ